MMSNLFMRAINDLPPDLIERADPRRYERHKRGALKFKTVAAALCIFFLSALILTTSFKVYNDWDSRPGSTRLYFYYNGNAYHIYKLTTLYKEPWEDFTYVGEIVDNGLKYEKIDLYGGFSGSLYVYNEDPNFALVQIHGAFNENGDPVYTVFYAPHDPSTNKRPPLPWSNPGKRITDVYDKYNKNFD